MSSQVPYLEERVGAPHVLTVDIDSSRQLDAALASVEHAQIKPFVPYEFSMEGFLERLSAYLQNQVSACSCTSRASVCAPRARSARANTSRSVRTPFLLLLIMVRICWAVMIYLMTGFL